MPKEASVKDDIGFSLAAGEADDYLTAHCLWAAPFPTLPLEVLALSGLETSKEIPAKLLKLLSFCLLQQYTTWEITWLLR